MDFYTIDFETKAIEPRPFYPPKPVGVSIKHSSEKRSCYLAWGHPIENNCTRADGIKALKKVWDSKLPIVMHNAKFDYDVATTQLGLPELPWQRLHDTMFMVFMDDPHAPSHSLKPSAERLLGMKPEEQDAVRDWLIAHQAGLHADGLLPEDVKITMRNFGAYISLAPGKLVGTYANGDVIRTEKLFKKLLPSFKKRKMIEAYDRERELLPIILKMEQQGLRVDLKRLRTDVKMFTDTLATIDSWLRKQLRVDSEAKLTGDSLVLSLIEVKKLDSDKLGKTATGKWATDKDSLEAAVTDKGLNGVLQYRSQLQTCVGTYMSSWLNMAELSKGYIYTSWNQLKQYGGGNNTKGTVTGRLSATWFMNIPKEFKPIFKSDEPDPKKAKLLPKCPLKLPPLPLVRGYIVPYEKDHVLLDRDYSQQEPRILAHFEGDTLMKKYNDDPWIDFHDYAKEELEKVGLFYERKPVKNTNLGLIYGMGVGKLAEKNNMTVEEASNLKKAIMVLYPGLKEMYAEMRIRAKNDRPIRTWGGREYFCEPPKIINGRTQTYDYKMVNTLIQGSAADCTKQAIIDLWNAIVRQHPAWKLLLTVHDEILLSAPKREMTEAMEVLRLAMEGVKFRVPMLSEGTVSTTNWAAMVDYDVKGKLVYKKGKVA
jgi:DNA polymerase I-like protein with 3'-5' exonuclease and polymerase domains